MSLALGGNRDLGGELESSLHWSATVPAARVEIDGRVIGEEGRVLV